MADTYDALTGIAVNTIQFFKSIFRPSGTTTTEGSPAPKTPVNYQFTLTYRETDGYSSDIGIEWFANYMQGWSQRFEPLTRDFYMLYGLEAHKRYVAPTSAGDLGTYTLDVWLNTDVPVAALNNLPETYTTSTSLADFRIAHDIDLSGDPFIKRCSHRHGCNHGAS